MSKSLLLELLIDTTRVSLPLQAADGSVPGWTWDWGLPAAWAIAYKSPGNPFHRDPKVYDAIVRFGDYNARSVTESGLFQSSEGDWRFMTWMYAMDVVRDQLDRPRFELWRDAIVRGARFVMRHCLEMDTFDGLIPNHGIWWHAMVYRTGQMFGVPEFREMAAFALTRVINGQTPDGAFREGQSDALMPGSEVTGYNLVSADAIDKYLAFSGDPRANEALEKAWRWYRDFLLPDHTMPPNFDSRQVYGFTPAGSLPAHWANKPEGRWLITKAWEALRDNLRKAELTGDAAAAHYRIFIGFLALKYDLLVDDAKVTPAQPALAEFNRMIAGEACVRRRAPWAVALCGLTNVDRSSHALRLFQQERQDLLAVHHKDLGLLIGTGHSQVQSELSSFVFHEGGAAHYLHQEAYLKSTPALDTLLLRYGTNIAALSADSNNAGVLRLIYSIHGERGHRDKPGSGHPLSAMAAKAHFTLRLVPGDVVTLGDKSYTLSADADRGLRLRVQGRQIIRFEGERNGSRRKWAIMSPDGWWDLRYPVDPWCPYTLWKAVPERVALVEALLHGRIWGHGAAEEGEGSRRPTATFHVWVE